MVFHNLWRERPSGLKRWNQNWKAPGWNRTRPSAWLRTRYKVPGKFRTKNVKPQWLTSSELGCPLNNGVYWPRGSQMAVRKKSSSMEPTRALLPDFTRDLTVPQTSDALSTTASFLAWSLFPKVWYFNFGN